VKREALVGEAVGRPLDPDRRRLEAARVAQDQTGAEAARNKPQCPQ
jgi:hypothetical protein